MPPFPFFQSRLQTRAPAPEETFQAEPWMWTGGAFPAWADLLALLSTDVPAPMPAPTPATGLPGSPFGGGPLVPPPPAPGSSTPGTSPFSTPWEPWRTGTPPYTFSPAPVNQQLV